MFTVHFFIRVQKEADKPPITLKRSVRMPFVPRVGDYVCANDWGLTFEGEGVQIESIYLALDAVGEVYAWLPSDRETYKDLDVWGSIDQMIEECYRGFVSDP